MEWSIVDTIKNKNAICALIFFSWLASSTTIQPFSHIVLVYGSNNNNIIVGRNYTHRMVDSSDEKCMNKRPRNAENIIVEVNYRSRVVLFVRGDY